MLARARESFGELVTRLRREWSRTLPRKTPYVPPPPPRPLLTAIKRQSVAQLKEVLSSGADINERFDRGMTALTLAAKDGWAEGVRLLLSRGANVFLRDQLGYSALGVAYWHGERRTGAAADAYAETINLLRAAGCPE